LRWQYLSKCATIGPKEAFLACGESRPREAELWGLTFLAKYRQRVSGTGKDALTLFEKHLPDITLMDLGLPDVHGIDVIRMLRETHPDARIIVLTTYLGDVQAIRALRAGASGYLLKATLRRDLLDSIRAVHAGLRHVQAEVATELGQHAADQSLTEREVEVLKLVAKGCSNKIVADRLHISEDTVKGHVRNILVKLKANDRTHAVTIALHRGFFEI
jgi:DNA-binding NarL/FixJ family response regulator